MEETPVETLEEVLANIDDSTEIGKAIKLLAAIIKPA